MQTQVPNHIFAEMHAELSALGKRTRRGECGVSAREQVFARYERLGLRRSVYYQKVRQMQGSTRSDYGRSRKREQWEPLIKAVFELQCQMSDFDRGRFMAAEVAIAHAEAAQIVPVNTLSKRNYNLWLKRLGLREARGIVRFQAAHSNQVHQVDVTGSDYLAVVADLGGGEFLLRRRNPRERLKKVPDQERLRLWSVAVKDDFSGLFASQYVVAPGESAVMVREILDQVWRGIDAAHPLRGLPEILYCDNGPFAKHGSTLPYLSEQTGVGVELKVHMPYRAQATGKVERVHQFQKARFEMQFLASREEWRLSEINEMVISWAIECGQLAHRYLGMSRADAFLAGLEGPVRLPSAESTRNAFTTLRRVAGLDGLISVDSVRYLLPNAMRNRRVIVYRNATGELRVEDPLTNEVITPEVWAGPRAYGDFESRPETQMDRTAKERDRGMWGELRHEQANAAAAKTVPFVAGLADEEKSTPFTDAPQFRDKFEAKTWLAKSLGIGLYKFKNEHPQLWAELEELLSRTLNREEIARWATRVLEGEHRAAFGGGQ